jgi:hypothetical protein
VHLFFYSVLQNMQWIMNSYFLTMSMFRYNLVFFFRNVWYSSINPYLTTIFWLRNVAIFRCPLSSPLSLLLSPSKWWQRSRTCYRSHFCSCEKHRFYNAAFSIDHGFTSNINVRNGLARFKDAIWKLVEMKKGSEKGRHLYVERKRMFYMLH